MRAIDSMMCDADTFTYHYPSYYYDLANKLMRRQKGHGGSTELKNLIRCLLFCTHSSFSFLVGLKRTFSENKETSFVTFPYPMVHLPNEQRGGPFHRDQLGKKSKTIWAPLSDANGQLTYLNYSQFAITSRALLLLENNGVTLFKKPLRSQRGNLYALNQYLLHAGAINRSNELRVGMTVRLLDHPLEAETTLPFKIFELNKHKNLFVFDDADYYSFYDRALLINRWIVHAVASGFPEAGDFVDASRIFGQDWRHSLDAAEQRFLSLYYYWSAMENKDQRMKKAYSRVCKMLNVERIQGLIF